MLPGFDKIVEERIRNAMRKGDFNDLEGAGKPLRLTEDANVPPELRMAYKILKNAGMTPPEIEAKREILNLEELLRHMPDTVEKYRTTKKLNFLIMKLNSMRGTSIELETPQHYVDRIMERIDTGRSAPKK